MKVLTYTYFCPENFEKVADKFKLAMLERQKGSEKFPKMVLPPHVISGEFKIVVIYENPTEEQLNNIMLHYLPVMTFDFVPLTEYTKLMEKYFKEKK